MADPLGVVTQRAVEELPGRHGDLEGQPALEGALGGWDDAELVPVAHAGRWRAARMAALSVPVVRSPSATARSASASRSMAGWSLSRAMVSIRDSYSSKARITATGYPFPLTVSRPISPTTGLSTA